MKNIFPGILLSVNFTVRDRTPPSFDSNLPISHFFRFWGESSPTIAALRAQRVKRGMRHGRASERNNGRYRVRVLSPLPREPLLLQYW